MVTYQQSGTSVYIFADFSLTVHRPKNVFPLIEHVKYIPRLKRTISICSCTFYNTNAWIHFTLIFL